ncbi:4432_t:CDS:2, partial [Racocetra persica]
DAFSDAAKDSKRGVYDKLRAKYICFYNDLSITKSWSEKSERMKSKPYPKMPKLHNSGFKYRPVERCEFIWKKEKEALNLTAEVEDLEHQVLENLEASQKKL